MKAPFQITRTLDFMGACDGRPVWYHVLKNVNNGKVVQSMYSTSVIAPKALRDLQAKLNTRVILD